MPRAARKTTARSAPAAADRRSPWAALVQREDRVARAALLGLAADAIRRTSRQDMPEPMETADLSSLLAQSRKIQWQVLDGARIGTLDSPS
ncbi:MAG: hypothetical protein QNJ94_09905 [Alphaproteobacteria bacterium]|nr:hypothetical protein [Alphaproteobacteria bacterium]